MSPCYIPYQGSNFCFQILIQFFIGECVGDVTSTWLHVAVSNTGLRLRQEIPVVYGQRPASGIDIYCFH